VAFFRERSAVRNSGGAFATPMSISLRPGKVFIVVKNGDWEFSRWPDAHLAMYFLGM
jgi:hypothetical protein